LKPVTRLGVPWVSDSVVAICVLNEVAMVDTALVEIIDWFLELDMRMQLLPVARGER